MRRRKILIGATLAAVALLAAIAWSIHRDNDTIRVRTTEIPISGLPYDLDGFTMLLVTDLHGKEFGVRQSDIARALATRRIDAIAITGDLVDRDRPSVQPAAEMLGVLPHDIPMAFVEGNSDMWSPPDPVGRYRTALLAVLSSRGADVDTAPLVVRRGRSAIAFCVPAYTEEDTRALKAVRMANVRVALNHFPSLSLDVRQAQKTATENFRAAAASSDPSVITSIQETASPPVIVDFDLLLAGHTHGGQVRLPFIGALYAPVFGFRPPQDRVMGLYRSDGRAQFVGTGLGSTSAEGFFARTPPSGKFGHWTLRRMERAASVRIGNPATLDLLVLRPARE